MAGVANGMDIGHQLAHCLRSLEVINAAGRESDTVEAVLADGADHRIQIPPAGAELQVYMGMTRTRVASRVVHRLNTEKGYSCEVEAEAPTNRP